MSTIHITSSKESIHVQRATSSLLHVQKREPKVPSSRRRPQGSQSPRLAPTEITLPTAPPRTSSRAAEAPAALVRAATRSSPTTVEEATRTTAWGRSGKRASCAVEKDPVEGCHLESGLNPPTVPAQRPSDVISTCRTATQAKATDNILTGASTGAGTRIGGGAKSEAGGSCVAGIWDRK
jgi:hypothetical protein